MKRNLVLFVAGGLLLTLGLAYFVSPFASGSPDGLERVAIDQGFAESAQDHALADSPLADYRVRGVEGEGISTAWSGIVGVAITFGAGLVLFGLIRTLRPRRQAPPA